MFLNAPRLHEEEADGISERIRPAVVSLGAARQALTASDTMSATLPPSEAEGLAFAVAWTAGPGGYALVPTQK